MKYDHGGEKYIKKIEVLLGKDDVIREIKIHSKIFLQNAPILSYTGHDSYAYSSRRIDTYIWQYNLSSNTLLTMNPGDFKKMEPILMVEILK